MSILPLVLATLLLAFSLFLVEGNSTSFATTLYKLPVPSAQAIYVTQGNDGADGHTAANGSQYAFDFGNNGSSFPIVAAREGTVLGVRSDSSIQCKDLDHKKDGTELKGCWKEANYVVIDHGDGSVALYLHLATDSVLVKALSKQAIP
jgi:murein DD-endopeptidase MepM/ murein hydrolase activator NlpD